MPQQPTNQELEGASYSRTYRQERIDERFPRQQIKEAEEIVEEGKKLGISDHLTKDQSGDVTVEINGVKLTFETNGEIRVNFSDLGLDTGEGVGKAIMDKYGKYIDALKTLAEFDTAKDYVRGTDLRARDYRIKFGQMSQEEEKEEEKYNDGVEREKTEVLQRAIRDLKLDIDN